MLFWCIFFLVLGIFLLRKGMKIEYESNSSHSFLGDVGRIILLLWIFFAGLGLLMKCVHP